MKRIFGTAKPQPQVTLDDTKQGLDGRVDAVDVKIAKYDNELRKIKEQMQKARPGTSTYNGLKQRGVQILKQKRMYENQKGQMMQQSFNLDQAMFTQSMMKDTIQQVNVMKQASKDIKKTMKKINIDEVERIQDSMQDLMDYSNEIQECLGRSYDVGEEVDDMDLEAELSMLEDEVADDIAAADGVPDYLQEDSLKDLEAPPSHEPAVPQVEKPVAM